MSDWETILEEHAGAVFGIARRILGSVHDAEDVAQDVFCEAYQHQCSQAINDWPGMLRRMAVLRSIDRLRRSRATVPLDASVEGATCDPSQAAIVKELTDRLRSSLARLPKRQAAVFSLAYFEQLSREEIASSLGISPDAVSAALYKARQKLACSLTGITQETGDD
jgi:RNA polymerase sigma-70 factor, ECF subfamily